MGIIIDCFAGGGGTSTGIEMATGRSADIAINHDLDAIAMHRANHPNTKHYCESIYAVNPKDATAGEHVSLAWFSPDCTHFSRAKGATPVKKEIRSLAWVVLRWAAAVKPDVIIVENVPEFVTWGPIRKGRPIKNKKGQTFNQWKTQLISLGYVVQHRELTACDYGAPTSRKRFFLIARRDGKKIVFPDGDYAAPQTLEVISGMKKPWRTAAEIIDWALPCPSIFERKKPLAVNTMRRIAKGLDKFVIKNTQPYIVKVNHRHDTFRGQSIDEPLQTVTAKNGYGVTTPIMAQIGQTSSGNRGRSVTQPLSTIVTKQEHMLTVPELIPYIMCNNHNNLGSEPNQPLHTVTTGNRHFICAPSLIQYHGSGETNMARGQKVDEPIMTIDTQNRYALVSAYFTKYYGNDRYGCEANEPLGTITTKDRHAFTACNLMIMRNNQDGQGLLEPLQTVCTSHGHFSKIDTLISEYTENINLGHWLEVRELLNEYCGYSMAENEILLFIIDGIHYFISDIGMRMLTPRELYNASGFPDNYIIDFESSGKPYSKAKQVARCGNAVPPPFAEALIRANLPELCIEKKSVG